MKKMLTLLRAGERPFDCFLFLPDRYYRFYFFIDRNWAATMKPKDLTTMLLLIAVAEGEQL